MPPTLTAAQRRTHQRWLLELTGLPTAAGREHRVYEWINRWLADRPDLQARSDRHGNMMISIRGRRSARPVVITSHTDHPAFVVRKVESGNNVRLEFRGGVDARYFNKARIRLHLADGTSRSGTIIRFEKASPFVEVVARLSGGTEGVRRGDVAVWDLPEPKVTDGRLHAPACDDLAGVAAALAALDVLRTRKGFDGDVRVLLTRAEEVGFLGCILCCEEGFVPRRAKAITLENSRSFAESPIGGGPIVRVGDRISIFAHRLTYAICRIAEDLAKADKRYRWQRKLMPGGACEASVFVEYGYEATCLCLPLGNYHNQGALEAVLAGKRTARPAPEEIDVGDFHGLVRLLVGCGERLGGSEGEKVPGIRNRLALLKKERGRVLRESGSNLS